jgi:hypothetical protein
MPQVVCYRLKYSDGNNEGAIACTLLLLHSVAVVVVLVLHVYSRCAGLHAGSGRTLNAD